MFTLKELEEDPSLLLDLKEDVREECETLGEVTNVVLYDVGERIHFLHPPLTDRLQKEPDGVMTVKFRDPISAQACVLVRLSFFNLVPSHASCNVAYVESPQNGCRKCKGASFPGARLKRRCGSANSTSNVAVSQQKTSRKSRGTKVKRSDWTPLPIGYLRKATEWWCAVVPTPRVSFGLCLFFSWITRCELLFPLSIFDLARHR